MEFLQEINWSPLWISLKTGAVATTIAFFLGIFCARKIMKMKPVSRAIWDGILTMPLVLPPTVAGFFLLDTDMERLRDRCCSDCISTDVPKCKGCF